MEPNNKQTQRAFRTSITYSQTYRPSPNVWATDKTVQGGRTAWVDYLNGFKNPEWRDQIKKVEDATTSADGYSRKVVWKDPSFSATGWTISEAQQQNPAKVPQWWLYYRGYAASGIGPNNGALVGVTHPDTSAAVVSADNLAIAKMYGQLNAIVQSANSGEDIYEVRQTLNALRHPLQGIRKLVTRSLGSIQKELGRRDLLSIPKALADAHLEFNFGIKPLTKTIAQAYVGLGNREIFANYHPFSAKGEKATGDALIDTNDAALGVIQQATGFRRSVATVRYQGVWAESVTVPLEKRAAADVLGLNIQNFLPTIWNVIPYSVLIDYVTNIGDIVDACAVPWGGVRWCCKTVRVEHGCYVQLLNRATMPPTGHFSSYDSKPGFIQSNAVGFSRRSVTNLPVPSLEFTGLDNVSGKQWQNVAALIVSKLPLIRLMTKNVASRLPKERHIISDLVQQRQRRDSPSFTF